MKPLFALQAELATFKANCDELRELEDDAIASIMGRPSDDIPFISCGKNQSSPVEKIVIMLVDDGGIQRLREMVRACLTLYQEVPHAWQELLKNVWRGKHTAELPEELLRRYETIRYGTVEQEPAWEAA